MSKPTTYRSDGGRWAKARATYLAHHPWCVRCLKAGRKVRAVLVDHRIPHRGSQALFWDKSNWDSLCSLCGNGDKQILERTGKAQYRGCSVDGTPLDPNHRWLRRELDASTTAVHTAERINSRTETVVEALK